MLIVGVTGPPERILVYYGGTGRAMYLGMLRVTTIFLFGAACFIVAPACWADESQQWMTPLGKLRLSTTTTLV